jgi:hypothetical protein
MKQPKSKLPFQIIGEPCPILQDVNERTVCDDMYTRDAEYIVEACNNYSKAIELLKRSKQDLDLLMSTIGHPRTPDGGKSKLQIEIEKFLKSIEDGIN